MHTKRIWKQGAHESEFWYTLKIKWCEFKYQEHWGKISKKEFFKNFKDYNEKYNLEWHYTEKGVVRWPTLKDYDTAWKHGYFRKDKYAWDSCYESYKEDKLSDVGRLCLEFNEKTKAERLRDNYRLKKRLRADTWHLSETPGNQYRINKNLESEKLLDEQDANILGEDKEPIDVNLNGNVAATVERDLSSDELMKFELDYAEKLIERAKR